MTTRILPYNEWHRLEETNACGLWQQFTEGVQVPIVAERDGRIIALLILLPVLHAECAWRADEESGSQAFGRVWQQAKGIVREQFDAKAVWGASLDDTMRGLMAHVQAKAIPGEHFIISVEDRSCRLSS